MGPESRSTLDRLRSLMLNSAPFSSFCYFCYMLNTSNSNEVEWFSNIEEKWTTFFPEGWPIQRGLTLARRLDWQWKGFFSSKSDDLESNTLNSGSLKRSVLKTSPFLLNHTWKRVREKSTLLGARSAASSHICFESSTSTSSDSTSGSSYPGPKEVASGSG